MHKTKKSCAILKYHLDPFRYEMLSITEGKFQMKASEKANFLISIVTAIEGSIAQLKSALLNVFKTNILLLRSIYFPNFELFNFYALFLFLRTLIVGRA